MICCWFSSEKNAWPADRQVGPIRKNQSRPASVRKVAGLSALTNGTSNRSDRWLAASVTSGSYAPMSAFTPSPDTSWVTASPALPWMSSPLVGVRSFTTRLTLAPPRLGRPASAASGSRIDGLSPLITSTASLAPFCASVPAALLGPFSWVISPIFSVWSPLAAGVAESSPPPVQAVASASAGTTSRARRDRRVII